MADITNLENVAKLLSPDQREQFYLTIQKFRTVPHDDDHLLMLNAMGFVALFMKELPSEIGKLIDQAGQRLTDDQSKALADQIREILTDSLDVPNYKDMSAMTRTIRETTQKNHDESRRLIDTLGHLQHEVRRNSRLSPILACSFATSLVTLAVGAVAAFFWLPKLLNEPITVPKHLWPYVELQRERRLYHFDSKLPNLTDEDVRIMRIKEGVLDAFREGEDAVIVLEKPMPDEVSDQSSTN